jgi:hypothetical protein
MLALLSLVLHTIILRGNNSHLLSRFNVLREIGEGVEEGFRPRNTLYTVLNPPPPGVGWGHRFLIEFVYYLIDHRDHALRCWAALPRCAGPVLLRCAGGLWPRCAGAPPLFNKY